MHILLPETDNCPSWISGRERMTVENISWSISTKECCCPRRGLNPQPPGLQSGGASNWATEAGQEAKWLPCLQNRWILSPLPVYKQEYLFYKQDNCHTYKTDEFYFSYLFWSWQPGMHNKMGSSIFTTCSKAGNCHAHKKWWSLLSIHNAMDGKTMFYFPCLQVGRLTGIW